MSALLQVTDLAKSFGGVAAVDGVSFQVAAGERLALIGPNGAGKTTCFNLLNGQLRADRVIVMARGRLIAEGTVEQIRRDPEVRRVYLGRAESGEAGEAAEHG